MSSLRVATALVGCAALVLLAGCASGGPHSATDIGHGTLITTAQIEASGARTAWDALRLNARQLTFTEGRAGQQVTIRRRGRRSILLNDQLLVFVDEVKLLDPRALTTMPASHIQSIRILSGREGTTYYGANAAAGVVLIRTKLGG